MERYKPSVTIYGLMFKSENGEFVKYEDVKEMLKLMIQYTSDISRKHILDILHKEKIE